MSKMEYDDIEHHNGSLSPDAEIKAENDFVSQGQVEYVLSSNEDNNIVAYRIVHVTESDDIKPNVSMTTRTTSHNANVASSSSTVVPQQLQYIVIDGTNGYLQAVPASAAVATQAATTSATNNTNQSLKQQRSSSVTIAPKSVSSMPSYVTTMTASAVSPLKPNSNATKQQSSTIGVFKKRDDRRRATHNEVERRRRDKINHWIMKLGSIIPADGTCIEIGQSGRVSIAATEGQSKGGILSKACEYIQMLQQKESDVSGESTMQANDHRMAFEKKKHAEEIARLRGENELLKAILIKNGINYTKERNTIKADEFS